MASGLGHISATADKPSENTNLNESKRTETLPARANLPRHSVETEHIDADSIVPSVSKKNKAAPKFHATTNRLSEDKHPVSGKPPINRDQNILRQQEKKTVELI